MDTAKRQGRCKCGGSHASNISEEDARELARILFAVHQRRAARLAGEAADAKGNRSKAKR